MIIKETITDLIAKGADFKVFDNELKVQMDKSLMTPSLKLFIKDNKQDIISYLKGLYGDIEKAAIKDGYALSSAQRRLYFLYELDKFSLSYNLPQIVELQGDLDEYRLQKAFDSLISRHEILRTSFIASSGVPVQKIAKNVSFSVETFQKEKSLDSVVKEFVRPFDLSLAPLFRVGLVELGDDNSLLMFDMHHIVTDGVSYSILIREFLQLYNGNELVEAKLQYKDYSEWQQSQRVLSPGNVHRDFWLDEFKGELPILELPRDYPRPFLKSNNGSSVQFELGPDLVEGIGVLSKTEKTTPFNVLLAVYTILLGKLSNQEDIIVGTPTAGRGNADLEDVVGMFVNTLPLRNFPKGAVSFKEFLSGLGSRTLNAIEHQSYQYEDLIEDLGIERNPERNPLFDASFSFENFNRTEFKIPGLVLKPYKSPHRVSKFDLTLIANEGGNGNMLMTFEYCADIFKEYTINKFKTYFTNILKAVLEDSGMKLSEISMLTRSEENDLLNTFNATGVTYPKYNSLIDLFEIQVAADPDSIAVVFEGAELSYGELEKRSNLLASVLVDRDIGPGSLVPICLERSFEMIVAILGVLRSGAAYVPIDPEYPLERIGFILGDVGTPLVLTQSKFVEKLSSFSKVECLALDAMVDYGTDNPGKVTVDIGENDLAYVIYTSGTTGKPKGVMIEHGAILNRLLWKKDYLQLTKGDTILQKTTYCFDVSVWELLLPLISSTKMVIAIPKGHKDNIYLEKVIEKEEVTTIHFVPSMLSAFLNNLNVDSCKSLKNVICSGEELKSGTVREFEKKLPWVSLHNLYGPTEAAIDVTAIEVSGLETDREEVPIGYPIANTRIYIVDANDKLQPVGVNGELLIGGVQVARGYLNRPELTSEKFIENPFLDNDSHKLYRTGDLAKRLPDGNIVFEGRIDHQVKLHGFRIELGEIEYELELMEDIKKAVVLVKEDQVGNKRLVAYVTSSKEGDITLDLRSRLQSKLPRYMVPQFYVRLDDIPVTPTGKLDRKSLPDPEIKVSNGFLRPKNDVQRNLVKIWSDILGVREDVIGITDNFFDLGGSSLGLLRMAVEINREFAVDLSVGKIFQFPFISSLAEFLVDQGEDNEPDPTMEDDLDQLAETMGLLHDND